ncbi:MAG: hypothetical protein WD572_08540 [Gammaproteobacteria bacterium]
MTHRQTGHPHVNPPSNVVALKQPDSPVRGSVHHQQNALPTLADYAWVWHQLQTPRWKHSVVKTTAGNLRRHILSVLGRQPINEITRHDILYFRLVMSQTLGPQGKPLSNDRINHLMVTLNAVLKDASMEFNFLNPAREIPQLSVDKVDVNLFTLAISKVQMHPHGERILSESMVSTKQWAGAVKTASSA